MKMSRRSLIKFPQSYQKSHRSFRNLLCSKNFRQFCGSQNWALFSRPILGGLIPTVSCNRSSKSSTLPKWVITRGLSDAQIQLISGHESKKSLEIYQQLSLGAVEHAY